MPKRIVVTPPGSRKAQPNDHAASAPSPGAGSGKGAGEETDPRPSSPFPSVSLRRTRFSSVPLVQIKQNVTETITFPASVELPRRHVTFFPDADSESSLYGGGLCSMSDTMESFKDVGGSPTLQSSVRIKHLTRNPDGTSRFPKLDECAHFHYDNVELGPVEVVLSSSSEGEDRADEKNLCGGGEPCFCVQVTSNGKNWQIRRSLDNFQMLDRQLHRCVYDRKFSQLKEIAIESQQQQEDALRIMLTQYLERFSQLAGSLINCGPVLNWLELDNRGNRLIVTDEAAINTPAVAAAYVIKRYASQASDEISLEVGDIISVIDMPPPAESSWWRGKKGFQVGFFPCECVEIIGDKVPQSFKIPKAPAKPVLRKHGKLIAFFRSFLLSRPSRRKLKQSGILKERVFGCDLGEHLMNTGRDIPLVLKCCTEFIEKHGIVDGIYRLSGVTSNIQKLRLAFDEDRVPNLTDEAILQDIHCVASLLKMYFRELPNPLLTFHLYDKFVSAVQADEDMRLLKLRDIVQQLPPPHYRSLEYLMRHLSKVAAFGFQTGMTPKNVAIVWAPNLLRDIENGGVGALHVVGVQAILTEYLIRYTDIIFSDKMPVFPSPKIAEETPKKIRPKSLAISTPTKLLSLEEARSRALTSNLPGDQQKFIDVGGGEENLPVKYHTVLELPSRRRSVGKCKKSPSGWKSFFSRGWHTTSGRRKNRRMRNERPKIGSPIFSENSPLLRQEKAITEFDVAHNHTKKLRTVKSAEALFPMNTEHQILDFAFSPVEENVEPPQNFDFSCAKESNSPNGSLTKSSSYQKHARSTSHDSYFERVTEFMSDTESVFEYKTFEGMHVSTYERTSHSDDEHLQSADAKSRSTAQDSPSRAKTAQKQKRLSFEPGASSPKLQKLSLKRLYHTLSSPPLERHKETVKRNIETLSKSNTVQTELHSKEDYDLLEASSLSLKRHSHELAPSVPLSDSSAHAPKLPNTAGHDISHDMDTVRAEVHNCLAQASGSQEDSIGELLDLSTNDDSDNLINFSMEATLSESVNLSQLQSFNSQEQAISTNCIGEQSEHNFALRESSFTPESATGDNVSEIVSGDDSEISSSDMNEQAVINNFVQEVQRKHCLNQSKSLTLTDNASNQPANDNVLNLPTNEKLASQPNPRENPLNVSPSAVSKTNGHSIVSISPITEVNKKQLSSDDSFVDDIISPPECFNDDGKLSRKDVSASNLLFKIGTLSKSPGVRTMERSKTEIHEICPKFVSGIAVSGSFGPELLHSSSDLDSQNFLKKRSCSDKISPISPIEDTKRKFESEIGRLIVRDRQMKMEMEQMKAERQKCKAADVSSPSDGKQHSARHEKKFSDIMDFRKSPIKALDIDRKKPDCEDGLKPIKENLEVRKTNEIISAQTYPRYVRIESKSSVKELLSKFESNRTADDISHRPDVKSSPKQLPSVFANVQVVNHSLPLTMSKSFASNSDDLIESEGNMRHSLSKEHIFQTECVIRFPHPKTSALNQSMTDPLRKMQTSSVDSHNCSSSQADHHNKVHYSRAAFLSSDNLSLSPTSPSRTFATPHLKENSSPDTTRVSRSERLKRTENSVQNGKQTSASATENGDGSFSAFKDSYNRANRLTAKMRNEFLKKSFPQEAFDDSGINASFAQDKFPLFNKNNISRSPPVTRKQHQTPLRQRPKSVPPPVCRLSAVSSKNPSGSQAKFISEYSQTVPKTTNLYFNKSSDTSQSFGKPGHVRNRAAIFERSLSFSGQADNRTLPSSSSHPQKAQAEFPGS